MQIVSHEEKRKLLLSATFAMKFSKISIARSEIRINKETNK